MKIIFNKLNPKVLIILGLFFLAVLSGVTYVVGVGTYTEGYRVNTGAGAQNMTVDSGGTCKKVTNTSGKDLFIPTKITAEWNAFVANKPTGVTIEACCSPVNATLSDWSACSATCGGGTQTRTCSGASCGGSTTCGDAALSQSCNTQACCNAATTCSGHGTCNTDGSCSCGANFTGTNCDSCATNYYSYPACISGYNHTDGYGHFWISQSLPKSKGAAMEACQHYYPEHAGQCAYIAPNCASATNEYTGLAVNCPNPWCDTTGYTICDVAVQNSHINTRDYYIWFYRVDGFCGWYVGGTGNAYNYCTAPLVNWY